MISVQSFEASVLEHADRLVVDPRGISDYVFAEGEHAPEEA
jgi:hypothetical protein